MRKLSCIVWLLLAGVASAAVPTAEVTGIQISSSADNSKMASIEWPKGVKFRVEFSVTDGSIVEFDRDASTIASIRDDKGTNLKGAPKGFESSAFSPFPQYAKDFKCCAVEVQATTPPAKDATSITLKGEAVLAVAAGQKEVTVENVALKVGTKFTLGDIPFELVKIDKADWGEGTAILLKTNRSLAALAEIHFVGADGKNIEVTEGMGLSEELDGKKIVVRNYAFKTLPATTKIVAKVWTDLKTVKVPMELKAGLGL